MTMKWMKVITLALAILLTLSGCSLITVDQDMVNAEPVAEYKDGAVTKGEYDEYMQLVAMNHGVADAEQLIELYGMYGMSADQLKESVLDVLIEERIVEKKAEEMGLTAISEEEEANAKAEAKTLYDEQIDYYTTLYDDGVIGEEEARRQATEALTAQGYTLEALEEQNLNTLWYDKLYEELTKDVAVTEEGVQEAYEERVASDEESYTDDLLSFEYATMNGDAVAWMPEGYRRVKHILIMPTDEQDEKLAELETALEDIVNELDLLDEEADEEGDWVEGDADSGEPADDAAADDTADGDDADLADTDSAAQKADLEAQKAQLERQIADLKVEYAESLKPRVDEAMARVEAGEDFDALIEELGEDPGMKEEPAITQGYYVSANSEAWDDAFKAAAMALENIGDVGVSQMGSSGIHIIKYIADVTPGAVPLDTIRDTIEEELLEELKSEKYSETVDEWIEAAEVKKYLDRL